MPGTYPTTSIATKARTKRGQATSSQCVRTSAVRTTTAPACSARIHRVASISVEPRPRDEPRVLTGNAGLDQRHLLLVRRLGDEPARRELRAREEIGMEPGDGVEQPDELADVEAEDLAHRAPPVATECGHLRALIGILGEEASYHVGAEGHVARLVGEGGTNELREVRIEGRPVTLLVGVKRMGHALQHEVHQHQALDERATVGHLIAPVDEAPEGRNEDRRGRGGVVEGGGSAGGGEPAAEHLVMARLVHRLLRREAQGIGCGGQTRKGARDAERRFFEDNEEGKVETVHLGERRRLHDDVRQRLADATQHPALSRPLCRRDVVDPTRDREIDRHVRLLRLAQTGVSQSTLRVDGAGAWRASAGGSDARRKPCRSASDRMPSTSESGTSSPTPQSRSSPSSVSRIVSARQARCTPSGRCRKLPAPKRTRGSGSATWPPSMMVRSGRARRRADASGGWATSQTIVPGASGASSRIARAPAVAVMTTSQSARGERSVVIVTRSASWASARRRRARPAIPVAGLPTSTRPRGRSRATRRAHSVPTEPRAPTIATRASASARPMAWPARIVAATAIPAVSALPVVMAGPRPTTASPRRVGLGGYTAPYSRRGLAEERQRDDDAVRAGSRPRADGRRHHEYASGKRGREGAKAPTLQRGQLREAGVDLGDVVRIREVREERVGGAWSFRASRRRNGHRLRVVGARDGDRGGIVQGTERARDRLRRVPFETPEDVADAGEGKIELVVGDHEGRRHAEDVGIAQRRQDEDGAEFRQCRGDGVGVEPLVLEEREEPARASIGATELDRRHEPATANPGDGPRISSGQIGETSEQARALAGGAVDEAAGRERLEHGEPHATGNVVVGKRRRVTQRERVIPEIGRRETSAEGEEPAAE